MKTRILSRFYPLHITVMFVFIVSMAFSPVSRADYTAGVYASISPVGASPDLHDVESVQPDMTLFQKSYFVNYSSLQGTIKNLLQSMATSGIQQTKTINCSFPCDEVRWSITPTVDFSFIDKQQPELNVLSSSQNGVHVDLDTSVKTTVHITFTGEADVWSLGPIPIKTTASKSITVDIMIQGPIHGQADLYLYPDVKIENVNVVIPQDAHAEINGIPSTLALAGAAAGSVIGFTPGGIANGGPLAWGITGIVFGDVAGDILQEELEKIVEKYVAKALSDGQAEAMKQVKSLLSDVQQINDIKNQFMNTPIPGLNGSINSLKSQLGLDLDVRTIKSGTDIKTIITARYSGNPAGGKVAVNFILPEKRCDQMPGNKHMFVTHNEDITVGQSCQSLFGGGASTHAFLGETPPGTSMANWKQGGTITFKGTVKRNQILSGISPKGGMPVGNVGVEGWLVCEAEISSLPQAGVIEVALSGKLASALTAAYNKDQRFLYANGGKISIGGTGTCEGVEGRPVPVAGKPTIISEKVDCPECLEKLLNPAETVVNQAAVGKGMTQGQGAQTASSSHSQIRTNANLLGSAKIRATVQNQQLSGEMQTRLGELNGGFGGTQPASRVSKGIKIQPRVNLHGVTSSSNNALKLQPGSQTPQTDTTLKIRQGDSSGDQTQRLSTSPVSTGAKIQPGVALQPGAVPQIGSTRMARITPGTSGQQLRVSVAGKLIRGEKLSLDIVLPNSATNRMSVMCTQGACVGKRWDGATRSHWEIPQQWIDRAGHYLLKVNVGNEEHEVAFNVAE